MKTIKYIFITIIAGLTLSTTSCSDFLDIKPTDEYLEDDIFSDAGLTQAFVNYVYSQIQDGVREHSTTSLTDDAYFTHNYGQLPVNEATVSESDLQWYDNDECPFHWTNRYKGIRYANVIINNIDQVPERAGYDLVRMKGEVHFLRAYMYAELVRGYGGVPLVHETFDLEETEEMQKPRNTIAECLEFIINDCEMAEKYLPETVDASETGRATKYAATALKARMMLHVASPLFADRTVNTLNVNQYDGDRTALYRNAKNTALEVINSGIFTLIDCNGATVEDIANNYKTIISENNNEQIFVRQFGQESSSTRNWIGLQHGPNGYHNWGGVSPTHDLVMAFEKEDGSLYDGFTEVGELVTENPYTGREPRFYATVGFDGSTWGRDRPADAYDLDPTPGGSLQCGTYELTNGDSKVELELPNGSTVSFTGNYGIDTRQGPIEDWNGSWTGYYERKLIDVAVDAQNYPQDVPWTFIRLAEMYLIVAEASIELGELEDAAEYLDALRTRIGMPDTKTTLSVRGQGFNQESMREFLRRERRVELTFEESRYYDVRRWMIAPETGNKTLTGVLIYARLKSGQTATKPYIHNENTFNYYYYVKSLVAREQRRWVDKMYFAPIKRDEIRRNPNLVQNPGME